MSEPKELVYRDLEFTAYYSIRAIFAVPMSEAEFLKRFAPRHYEIKRDNTNKVLSTKDPKAFAEVFYLEDGYAFEDATGKMVWRVKFLFEEEFNPLVSTDHIKSPDDSEKTWYLKRKKPEE